MFHYFLLARPNVEAQRPPPETPGGCKGRVEILPNRSTAQRGFAGALLLGIRILIFSVNPIRRDANTYADADTNQGQHARMSRTCPGACCAFDDSFSMSATLRRLVRDSERCAVF
jgi:hypothetical protein